MADTPEVNLTPAMIHIMLALGDGEKHGYAIMQDVAALTDGAFSLGPGTLYRTIKQMLSHNLIQETEPDILDDDERRRYYKLTETGGRVISDEMRRMEVLLSAARRRGLMGGSA